MELIKIHYNVSKPVTNYGEIEYEVAALKQFIIEADKKRGCFTIHHAQVHAHPYNFFVLHPRYVLGDDRLFNDRVIINPTIIEPVPYLRPEFKDTGLPDNSEGWARYNKMPTEYISQEELEGCMSFPFRKPKKVERYVRIKVSYNDTTTILEGQAAHIFQHEVDHGFGKNIYFKE